MSMQNNDLWLFLHNQALRSTAAQTTYYEIQRRHADGKRWVEVGRFPSRAVAKMSLEAILTHAGGDARHFRIKRVAPGG